VNAIYRYLDSTEYKKSSKIIDYTALGPPLPPKLTIITTDIQSITLNWTMSHEYPRPEFIKGYKLVVDGSQNQIFEKHINEFIFKDMQPGKKYDIEIVALTNWIVGQSNPSNKISLLCPNRPYAPLITQAPSAKPFTVIIGWKSVRTRSTNKQDQILLYKYFKSN
jgi:hypothetical protein